jgi:hypothetical protein
MDSLILAIEAEASSPDELRAALDVERLARAQHASYERDPSVKRIEWGDLTEAERRMWIIHARVVAAEYAALASKPSAEPE